MSNNLHIIARYKEDLGWVKYLKGSAVIYNKGDEFPYDYPHINIPNIGRETETFVRGIIENYNVISDFDYVVFLQGNPFEHCKDLLQLIDLHDTNDYYCMCDSLVYYYYPKDDIINGIHASVIARLYRTQINWEYYLTDDPAKKVNHSIMLENAMVLCHILGINPLSQFVFWGHGAQYMVPKEMILNKSLNWWKEFHKLIMLVYGDLKSECGYAAEAIWPLIWKHNS